MLVVFNSQSGDMEVDLSILQEVSSMRLTIDQRIQALERDNVILHDTIELLHRLLKEQHGLINDYIVQKIGQSNPGTDNGQEDSRPEDALYTFICQQRFKRLENDIKRIFRLIDESSLERKAG